MKIPFPAALALAAVALAATTSVVPTTSAQNSAADPASRGRYLVRIAGCNDCHTAGFAMSNGATPEKDWLAGDALGWQGPWGTTYAPNLREMVSWSSDDKWVDRLKNSVSLPPMPWYQVQAMAESDMRSLYLYIKSLGAPGETAPFYRTAGKEPKTPYVTLEPPQTRKK